MAKTENIVMQYNSRFKNSFYSLASVLLICLLIVFPTQLVAQVTTGNLQGTVMEKTGESLPFANVIAIHQPTGTSYGATTAEDGRYILANLKPGGPYTLEVSFVGYETARYEELYITLGQTKKLNIEISPATETLEAVELVYNVDDPFENDKSGVSSNIDKATIESVPTLHRSLQDVTRLSPQGGQSSFGGSNYRYNNLSIDGASNNDVLGFQEPSSGAAGSVASGTPGALAGTQPVSLDAIQEVQVSIAPFDVQQGNFTGASINAVTRSGTNQTEGSVYFFGRNQRLTGRSVDENRTPIADYHDFQTGMRLGGAIVENKLFYFVNYERTGRSEPVLNAPGDPGTQISADIAQAIRDTLVSRYNYDPGSFGAINNERKSDKVFIRLDYNLNDNNQLTIRDNFVAASADNLERGETLLKYSSQGFTHVSRTNSLVGELKSRINDQTFNHLIVGYNTVNDERVYDGDVFPHVDITYNSANTILLGTYREASIYGLTLNTTQFTNNLKFYKGKHTLTLGTNNDLYNIQYRFLTAWNGRWEYNSLQDFYDDMPSRIRGVYNYGDNSFEFNKNNPSADFRVMLLSGYIQDKMEVNDRLSLTAGIRLDMQVHPDKVPINPEVVNTPEFSHFNNDFGGVPQINPRVAFQYQLDEEGNMQIRGGSGLFTGRIPFAWYAYSHYISGENYGNIDLRPDTTQPIVRDLSDLRPQQPNLTEINLVDNDFKLPRAWRSSLAVDMKLPNGYLFTLEGMYSKALDEIWFRSINLKDSTANLEGADNRPYYLGSGADKKVNPNFTNVFLLTNTNKGYKYFVTASIRKTYLDRLDVFAAYTYGESKDIMNGVRNSMAANFSWNQSIESNDPELAYSNFDVRHRVIASASYTENWNVNQKTSFVMIYGARSGFPYSYTVAGDVNRDGSSKNDLFYVPENQSEIDLVPIEDGSGKVLVTPQEQWEQLDSYIENDAYLSTRRGQYAERNGARAPWNHTLDLRINHQSNTLKKAGQSLEVSLDIINVLNLINPNWGLQSYIPNVRNSSYQLIDFEGIQNNRAQYAFKNPQGNPWQTDALNSRWQAQIGLRYNF